MHWYLGALRNYFGFSGRARRSEFWYFVLFNVMFAIVLTVLDMFIDPGMVNRAGYGVLSTLYILAVFIPGLALQFRRLHDTDRSAWWLLLLLIPILGPIALIVFYCLPGTSGANRFGPDPKAA